MSVFKKAASSNLSTYRLDKVRTKTGMAELIIDALEEELKKNTPEGYKAPEWLGRMKRKFNEF